MTTQLSTPLITTVIPTFRRPELLKRAIQSILNQTYKNFKVIIYDDASEDETEDVVIDFKKKDPRVKYFRNPKNIGSIENYSYAMKHIATPLFSFLSDDDFLLPNFFTDAVEALKQNPEAICFCGGSLMIDFNGKISGHDLEAWEDGVYYPPSGFLEMIRKIHPLWQSTLFKREIIDDIGILDPEILAIDYDYLLRVAAQKIIVVSKNPCSVFQYYPSSVSPRYKFRTYLPGLFKVIKNINNIEVLSEGVKKEFRQNIMKFMQRIVFRSGLKAIGESKLENIEEVYEILNSKFTNTPKTLFFNLIYHSNYSGKKLIALLYKLRPIKQIFREKNRNSKYKKYEHLIDNKMVLSYSSKWAHKIDK